MAETYRVLLLEDSDDDAALLRRHLEKSCLQFEIERVETEHAFRQGLSRFRPHLVLADLVLPTYDGRRALEVVRHECPDIPFIFVSGSCGEEIAIEALKLGATDYVLKHRLERLGPAAVQALTSVVERDRRIEVEGQLHRRMRYQSAASKCVQLLASREPDHDCLTEVLRLLRDTARASRVYVFQHEQDSAAGDDMSPLVEVVADDATPATDDPRTRRLPYHCVTPMLLPKLLVREPYMGITANMPETERSLLMDQEILSVLVLPIFCEDRLWGFIGFDDCRRARQWAPEDVSLLQVVADMIGVAKHRQQVANELRLQSAALKAAANAIVITDRQGTIEWVNPAWTNLTGYTPDETVGRDTRLTQSGVQDDAFYKRLWETILAGEVWEGELYNRRKDGTIYPEHETITPVRNAEGHITHFIAIKEDVTLRRSMEQSIRESEERLRMALEAGGLGTFDWNIKTNKVVLSSTHSEIFGYSSAEAAEADIVHFLDRVHPDDRPQFEADVQRAIREHRPYESEYRIVQPDGSIRWIAGRAKVAYDDAGEPERMVGTTQDITVRKETESRLRLSEERFKIIAEASNDAIWDWDLETDALWWGDSFFALFGFEEDDIEPTIDSWTSRIHPDDARQVLIDIELAIHNGPDDWEHEYRFQRKDGSWAYVFDRGHVVRNEQGKGIRMYGGMTDLTARKHMEKALAEGEERLRLALHAGRLGTLDWNLLTGEVVCSATFFDVYGSPSDRKRHVAIQDLIDRLHPEDQSRVSAERQTAIDGRGHYSVEYRVVWPDDSVHWIAEQGETTCNFDGTPMRLVGTVQDITERRRTEEQMRQHVRNTEFRSAIGASMSRPNELPDLLEQCTQAMVEYLGAAHARIWVLNRDEQLLRLAAGAGEYRHFDRGQTRVMVGERSIGQIAATGEPLHTNLLQVDDMVADSQWVKREGITTFAAHPLMIEERCVGVMALYSRAPLSAEALTSIAAVSDIIAQNVDRVHYKQNLARLNADLERRIDERTARLSESEKFNRATLDALSAHVAVMNTDGEIVAVNQAWRDFATKNDVEPMTVCKGANYLKVCDRAAKQGDQDARVTARAFRQLLSGDLQTWTHEYPCHGPTERRWFHCRGRRFMLNNEPRVLVSHENVTAMKQTEEALREAKAAAEKASAAKSEFLAAMSHELRTPLNGILGMNDLLRTTDLTTKQREFVEISSASGRLLLQLINDILDLSKIEAGKLELDLRPTDIEMLAYRVADILSPMATQKGLKLNCRVAPDACVVAKCDDNRLQQILINLVNNAVKFTNNGEVTISVDRRIGRDGGSLLYLQVIDTGIGIPQERRDRLFQKFSQIDSSTTRQFGGTGLGLSICRQLAELMGGRIDVESQVGVGSTFWVELPLDLVNVRDRFSEHREVLKGTRMLAIDGLDRDRMHVADCLQSWQCEFVQIADVAEALLTVEQALSTGRPYQLVLADCQLVTGNQYSQLQELAATPGLQIIGLGVPTDESVELLWHSLGVRYLLPDPIRPSTLYNVLCTALCPTAAGARAAVESQHVVTLDADEVQLSGHVLVAEDNRINQVYTLELLKHFGLTTDLATNGEEAVTAVRSQKYDLVLMDCQMPRVDGFDATRNIRQLEDSEPTRPRVPIVALTANAMAEDRRRCLEAGMDDYLAKPVDAEQARVTLAKYLAADPQAPAAALPRDAAAEPHVGGAGTG